MPTNPGINDKFPLRSYNQDDLSVIYSLAREFYITRPIDTISIGNSEYTSFLMRPAESTHIYLNSEREIMVLMSKYDTFEARTLQAYERILYGFDDQRIDQTVRFLISNYKEI